MNKPIQDHGENDPIPFDFDPATAQFTGRVIQIHRQQLNDRDKAREMAANEREIEWFLT